MARPIPLLRSVSRIVVGNREISVVHEVSGEIDHKLNKAERKARREDNKEMKLSRQQHRKRRKHGR